MHTKKNVGPLILIGGVFSLALRHWTSSLVSLKTEKNQLNG